MHAAIYIYIYIYIYIRLPTDETVCLALVEESVLFITRGSNILPTKVISGNLTAFHFDKWGF